MLGGLAALGAIVFFVTAHEAGHFFAAKLTGMKATQFFFGFGPKLWSTQRGETEYGIKALPLGGYVRIAGMNPLEEVDPADVGRTYREKKFWQKSFVVLAGVAMNFLFAYLIFTGLFLAEGIEDVDRPLPAVGALVGTLEDGTRAPAREAGLLPGDEFVEIDGQPIRRWEDVPETIAARPNETVEIVVRRDGELLRITAELVTREDPDTGAMVGFLGVAPDYENDEVGLFTALGLAGRSVVTLTRMSFEFLADLVRPSNLARLGAVFFGQTDVPDELRPVSPVGIVQIGAQASSIGVSNVIWLMGAVNIILGLLNVLPLYPLDGGHFAVALYERVTHREVDIRKLAPIAAAVIALVFFLGFVAIYLDIVNPFRFAG